MDCPLKETHVSYVFFLIFFLAEHVVKETIMNMHQANNQSKVFAKLDIKTKIKCDLNIVNIDNYVSLTSYE